MRGKEWRRGRLKTRQEGKRKRRTSNDLTAGLQSFHQLLLYLYFYDTIRLMKDKINAWRLYCQHGNHSLLRWQKRREIRGKRGEETGEERRGKEKRGKEKGREDLKRGKEKRGKKKREERIWRWRWCVSMYSIAAGSNATVLSMSLI